MNLNSAASTSSPATPPEILEADTTKSSVQTPLDRPSTPTVTQDAETSEAQESRGTPSTAVKRKLRSSRLANGEESSKRYKPTSSAAKDYTPPTTRLSDLGGVEACVEKMLELVAMPLCHPEVYLHTGVQPPRGVLLHGPPGCGKTLLANAIAGVRLEPTLLVTLSNYSSSGTWRSIHQCIRAFNRLRYVW